MDNRNFNLSDLERYIMLENYKSLGLGYLIGAGSVAFLWWVMR